MKKTKKKTTAKLRKDLWTVFTKYIKARDKYICITCGKYATSFGMGGGHYKPKGACGADYYFSEYNVNAQCTYCNLTLQGNQVVYRERIRQKYGEKVLNDIEMNYHNVNKNYPYESKIEEYKAKLEELNEQSQIGSKKENMEA